MKPSPVSSESSTSAGEVHVAAEELGQCALDVGAEADLELVAGEDVRHHDRDQVSVQRHRLTGVQPTSKLGRRGRPKVLPSQERGFSRLLQLAHSFSTPNPVPAAAGSKASSARPAPAVAPCRRLWSYHAVPPHRYPQLCTMCHRSASAGGDRRPWIAQATPGRPGKTHQKWKDQQRTATLATARPSCDPIAESRWSCGVSAGRFEKASAQSPAPCGLTALLGPVPLGGRRFSGAFADRTRGSGRGPAPAPFRTCPTLTIVGALP